MTESIDFDECKEVQYVRDDSYKKLENFDF